MAEARTELIDGLAAQLGVPPLTPAEIEAVLALAAVAAHGTGDRTSAPLTTFLVGLSAGSGDDRLEALNGARRRAAELAPEAQPG
jgi:hypothetical protein